LNSDEEITVTLSKEVLAKSKVPSEELESTMYMSGYRVWIFRDDKSRAKPYPALYVGIMHATLMLQI
jgi:hypothetical protein